MPFFCKQLGSLPVEYVSPGSTHTRLRYRDTKGGDPAEWPEDLRVREFPRAEG